MEWDSYQRILTISSVCFLLGLVSGIKSNAQDDGEIRNYYADIDVNLLAEDITTNLKV